MNILNSVKIKQFKFLEQPKPTCNVPSLSHVLIMLTSLTGQTIKLSSLAVNFIARFNYDGHARMTMHHIPYYGSR